MRYLVKSFPQAEAELSELIAFPTVSKDSNIDLLEGVAAKFLLLPQTRAQMLRADEPGKANLIASLGPDIPGGLALSGHSDVVPVEGQEWDSDPFVMRTTKDRLWGRGVCDMKGFTATIMALLPQWSELPLKKPIHLLLSHDEEVGCTGAHQLADAVAPLKPALIVIGEPSNMQPLSGNKGVVLCRTTVRGQQAHSSQPLLGVSAIEIAARLIQELKGERFAHCTDELFDPPESTLAVNVINGGTAHNIMAGECEFTWELRTVPPRGQDSDEGLSLVQKFLDWCDSEVLPQLRQTWPEVNIETEVEASVPAMRPCFTSAAEQLVRSITGDNAQRTASFATEAGIFQQADMAVVILGPGDIAQAHQPNEWIYRDQLVKCADFLNAAVRRHCC